MDVTGYENDFLEVPVVLGVLSPHDHVTNT
jgi:hypothetical protein